LLGYRNDVTAVSTTSQVTLTAGVWYEAQMHLRVNGAASTVEVWLNGARIDALSTITASLGTTAIGRIQLGDNVAGRSYDFACDPLDPHFNGGAGTANACRERFVSDLILSDANVDAVAALGDVQDECGGLSAFQQSYEQSWGRVKSITRPAVGNHEYIPSSTNPPGTDCDATGNAGGYVTYFGSAAGDPSKGYYSYDSVPGTSWCSTRPARRWAAAGRAARRRCGSGPTWPATRPRALAYLWSSVGGPS
jgi:hypothetical protein